jgi:hypothetical protein
VLKSIFILLVSILHICCSTQQNNNFSKIDFQKGDIVFRKGIGAKTRAVLQADKTGIYSHVGIIVATADSFGVIHITPGEREANETVDRIKMETPQIFFGKDRAQHGAVYRLTNDTLSVNTAVMHARRLLKNGIAFDHDYNLEDTTTMYCTELVYYVYMLAGKDITSGKRSEVNMPVYNGTYIFPSNIYTNNDFKLIYKF